MTDEKTSNSQSNKTEKIWDATKKGLHTAAFKATQMKRVVQKRIDLAAIHKKISSAHTDLGKQIDDCREAGEADILDNAEVAVIFARLDQLKRDAAALEEEIETIKAEEPAEPAPAQDETPPQA
ncbi:MAG: hypothetical protein SCI25_01670 [Desulfuromonadales bacterium]|nr:hypothetical protein [Desulfuromonadales bacterium]MDW7756220.1 hypothetical protein [Desulfuromonadales bacterium]